MAFVFPDPAEAEKNRARMWRYEHQVRAIEDGVERRLELPLGRPCGDGGG